LVLALRGCCLAVLVCGGLHLGRLGAQLQLQPNPAYRITKAHRQTVRFFFGQMED
jgi:hypothetical protein